MADANEGYGYAGKILRVDLSDGEISTEPTEKYAREWLGSGGIAIKILYDELKAWVTPYEPANKIIFGAGVLQGTTAPAACKMTISTLGPMIGGWATSASDSYVGGQLKFAGYDLVVVSGKAHKPVYLWIDDDRVEIRDASHLWGRSTSETLKQLRDDPGDPSLHIVSIGPAGENLVRGGCVVQDEGRAFGRCGIGAVMGSKNLKALVARGTGSVRVADPDRFLKIVRELRVRAKTAKGQPGMQQYGTLGILQSKQNCCGISYKNFQEFKRPYEMAEAIDPERTIDRYRVGRSSFPGCLIGCGQVVHFDDGPFAGLTTTNNQWEVLGTMQGRLAVWEPQFMFKANALCNDLGIDVDMAGGVIGWAMECYQRGIITEQDTGGLKLEWGAVDLILDLIEKISYRKGFGDLLAEGCARAAELLGRDSSYYAMHIKGQELYEPCRGAMAWALGTTTSTRGGGHTTGAPAIETTGGLDPDKLAKVCGVREEDTDPLGYSGKPQLVMFTEALQRTANCLSICHFNTAWSNLDSMSLPEMAEMYSAATGWETSVEDLKEVTMRQLNLEKAFNLRHTDFSRQEDMPTPRDLNEPIPTGRLAGWKIDEAKWNEMLDEYYEIHGWDRQTGYPTRKTLEDLGLKKAAEDLERIGKLGRSN
jgi:aldehyde:ferredoxin oxidoreductase